MKPMREAVKRTVVAVALLLAGCSVEGEAGPQGPQGAQGPAGYSPLASGTRIKARVGTTPDGAKMFLGWHDAERGENCSFRTAADGKTRCLPDVYISMPNSPGRRFFSDADCSASVIRATDCMGLGTCEIPSLALYSPSAMVTPNGNASMFGVYSTDGVVSGRKLFEATDGGSCVDIGSVPYLTVSGEVEPTAFQELSESLD